MAKAPMLAALSPSPATAPVQTGPVMDDGVIYPPGCVASSTDVRFTTNCMLGWLHCAKAADEIPLLDRIF